MMFQPQQMEEKQDKFSCAERVFLHVDKNNLGCIQFIVAICYKIPEDAFCTISIKKGEENTSFYYYTSLGKDDNDLKLFVYGCNFSQVVHGNAVLDNKWAEKSPNDAWMIRLSPYGTTDSKQWAEKLKEMEEKDVVEMLSSFNLMGGSKVLGRGERNLKHKVIPRKIQKNSESNQE
jgi:hypothetical protein